MRKQKAGAQNKRHACARTCTHAHTERSSRANTVYTGVLHHFQTVNTAGEVGKGQEEEQECALTPRAQDNAAHVVPKHYEAGINLLVVHKGRPRLRGSKQLPRRARGAGDGSRRALLLSSLCPCTTTTVTKGRTEDTTRPLAAWMTDPGGSKQPL